ncbi:MAG: hypothetical protein WCG44_01300 [bacterium]
MVKIYTLASNRPDFIPLQVKSLSKFIEDDFEYIVINNGSNPILRYQIYNVCRVLNIKCINSPYRWYKDACYACGIPLQWAFEKYISKDVTAAIIDSDLFPIAKVNMSKFISGYQIAGVLQQRGDIGYLWNGLLYFNEIPSPNTFCLMPGKIRNINVDVGGYLYYWISENKPRIKYITHTSYITKKNRNLIDLPESIRKKYDDSYTFEIYNGQYLHYSRGSNWDKPEKLYRKDKTKLLFEFVNGAIDGSL